MLEKVWGMFIRLYTCTPDWIKTMGALVCAFMMKLVEKKRPFIKSPGL